RLSVPPRGLPVGARRVRARDPRRPACEARGADRGLLRPLGAGARARVRRALAARRQLDAARRLLAATDAVDGGARRLPSAPARPPPHRRRARVPPRPLSPY